MIFKLWVDWLMVCFGRVIKFDNCAGLINAQPTTQRMVSLCLYQTTSSSILQPYSRLDAENPYAILLAIFQ